MAVTHKYTVICDDVRQEANRKFILIGVYISQLIVEQIPANLKLTFFQLLDCNTPGTYSAKINLAHLETGKQIAEGLGGIIVSRPGPSVNLMTMPLKFEATGTYQLCVRIDQEEPIIVSFDVTLGQVPKAQ